MRAGDVGPNRSAPPGERAGEGRAPLAARATTALQVRSSTAVQTIASRLQVRVGTAAASSQAVKLAESR
jgi:hypothetical protein